MDYILLEKKTANRKIKIVRGGLGGRYLSASIRGISLNNKDDLNKLKIHIKELQLQLRNAENG